MRSITDRMRSTNDRNAGKTQVMNTAIRPDFDRSLLIEGLGKGLRVIEAFSDEHPRLTATEAGRLTGLTRTAARRYLMSLVYFGYADTDGKQYWLLPRVLRVGQSYLDSARLPRLVQPFVQRLSMQTGETANLSVLDGHDVVYMVRSNAPRVISIGFHSGARVPAHVVSPGYVTLSTWSDDEIDAWIAEHDFSRFSPYTITDPALFKDNVLAARKLGYWTVDQHIDMGLGGIAVPLNDRKGRCTGALSMTFQRQAYPDDEAVKRLLPSLMDAAQVLRGMI
jgi:IclR family pca regulon transcriptional regulator